MQPDDLYEPRVVTLIAGVNQELLDLVLNEPGGLRRYIQPLIIASSAHTVTTITMLATHWPTTVDEELAAIMRFLFD